MPFPEFSIQKIFGVFIWPSFVKMLKIMAKKTGRKYDTPERCDSCGPAWLQSFFKGDWCFHQTWAISLFWGGEVCHDLDSVKDLILATGESSLPSSHLLSLACRELAFYQRGTYPGEGQKKHSIKDTHGQAFSLPQLPSSTLEQTNKITGNLPSQYLS